MYIGLNVKCSLFLSAFNETWIFATDFRNKKPRVPHFTNGSCVVPMRTGRQTAGHDEDDIRFSNFSNAPISVDGFIVVSVNGHNCSVQQVRNIMSVWVEVM